MPVNIDMLSDLATKYAIFAPVIAGVVQAVKVAGLPARFLPVLAILLGGFVGWLYVTSSIVGVLIGVTVGLSSVGLYETVKTTRKG